MLMMCRRRPGPSGCDNSMLLLLFILCCVTSHVIDGQSSRVDYPYACPEECQCQTTLRNGVYVECALLSIGLWSDFRAIQSNFTQGLIIQCDARHLESKLLEGAFAHLLDLEKLSLVDCAFTKVPKDAFLGLPRLKTLTISTRVSNNYLQLEEGSLRRLEQLETLDLHQSNVQRLPENELCALKQLKFLHLQDNAVINLAHLGTIGGCLSSLEAVYLDGNSVRTLDKDLSDTVGRKLRILSLSRNKLDSISDDAFSRLELLTDLDLSRNLLESISDGLFKTQTGLERLWLNGNQLQSLPVNAFNNLNHLRQLNLSQNALTNKWINGDLLRNCLQVQTLDLSQNQMTHIDRSLLRNLLNLNQLRLQQNRIEWIEPQAFTYQHKLETLDLSQNLLPSLEDDALDGLFALSRLNLSMNQLKALTESALADSKKLASLDLCSNQIQQLNPTVFLPVRSLQTLRLCRNQLTTVLPSLLRHLVDLQTLDLSENRLKTFEPETFANKPNLKMLTLSNNDLVDLRESAFDSLLRLEDLQLDGNLLQSLGNWTQSKFSNLLRLNVSNNQISQLPLSDLPRSLVDLDAHSNSITQLSPAATVATTAQQNGPQLSQLRHVDLSSNQLTSVGPKDLPSTLQTLNLADNRIDTIERHTFYNKPRLFSVNLLRNRLEALDEYALRISPVEAGEQLPEFQIANNPFLCNCQMVYMKKVNSNNFLRWYPLLLDLPELECREMRTKYTRRLLDVPDESFLCDYKEQCFSVCHCCDFAACDCKMTCPDNCTCYHDQKWEKNIIDCSVQQLATIPMMVPMDSTDVYLDGNVLPVLPEHALIGRSRMYALYLNNSQIQRIDNHTFNGLTHLKVLHLHHNQITLLRGYEFVQLESLEILDLSWNDIHSIHPNTFAPLTKLKVLNLAGNQLDSLVTLPVPLQLNSNALQFYLANNLWECWCNEDREKTLTEWLIKYASRIADIHHMHCYDRSQYPALLRDMKKPRERCSSVEALTRDSSRIPVTSESSDSLMMLVGVILGCVCFVVILVVAVGLRYRYEIQVRLYSRFRLRLCSSLSAEEDEESDYAYEKICDAFISYSDLDEHLVLGELAPRLEFGSPKYKLFLHYRDHPQGMRTPESIIQGVQLSKRTILVLSENYLKREWSKLDFKTAHQQVFKDKKNKIIIVMLGDVQIKDLDVDLRIYLKSNPCLHWGEKLFWKKLYYALPDPEPVLENHYSHTLSSIRNGHIYSYPITDL